MKTPTRTPLSGDDGLLSRRDFAILSIAAGAAAHAGPAQAAATIADRAVEVRTPDGVCDAVLVHAQGKSRKPGIILYPDAFGLRPTKVDMARRLAGEGFTVLAVNQFYRLGKAPVLPAGFSAADPDQRAMLMKMIADLDHDAVTRDAKAHVAFLDAQSEVDRNTRIGTVGYCMGGAMAVRTAAAVPDRVGAAVSFHGGRLVTDAPVSPHRLLAATKAAYHIGIAADDDAKEPESKTVFAQALAAAGLSHTLEVYPGSRHGWTMPDSDAYDATQAQRAWTAMTALFKQALV